MVVLGILEIILLSLLLMEDLIMVMYGGIGDGTGGIDGTVGDGDGMPGAGTLMVLVDSMTFMRILSIVVVFMVGSMADFMILSALHSIDITLRLEEPGILIMDISDMVEEGIISLIILEDLIPLVETSRQIPEEDSQQEEVLPLLEEAMA